MEKRSRLFEPGSFSIIVVVSVEISDCVRKSFGDTQAFACQFLRRNDQVRNADARDLRVDGGTHTRDGACRYMSGAGLDLFTISPVIISSKQSRMPERVSFFIVKGRRVEVTMYFFIPLSSRAAISSKNPGLTS